MYHQQIPAIYINQCLSFAQFIFSFGVFQDEEMPIEPEGYRQEDWEQYHNTLDNLMDELNNRATHVHDYQPCDPELHSFFSEDEVHPMYCRWCGAEYGEDWAQCDCWDDTGLEVES